MARQRKTPTLYSPEYQVAIKLLRATRRARKAVSLFRPEQEGLPVVYAGLVDPQRMGWHPGELEGAVYTIRDLVRHMGPSAKRGTHAQDLPKILMESDLGESARRRSEPGYGGLRQLAESVGPSGWERIFDAARDRDHPEVLRDALQQEVPGYEAWAALGTGTARAGWRSRCSGACSSWSTARTGPAPCAA